MAKKDYSKLEKEELVKIIEKYNAPVNLDHQPGRIRCIMGLNGGFGYGGNAEAVFSGV